MFYEKGEVDRGSKRKKGKPRNPVGLRLSAVRSGLMALQTSLKLLLLLLELLKLGFSVRLVGIETAPAFSETHAESSFTPLKPTLPLLFAERVPTARSHKEFDE